MRIHSLGSRVILVSAAASSCSEAHVSGGTAIPAFMAAGRGRIRFLSCLSSSSSSSSSSASTSSWKLETRISRRHPEPYRTWNWGSQERQVHQWATSATLLKDASGDNESAEGVMTESSAGATMPSILEQPTDNPTLVTHPHTSSAYSRAITRTLGWVGCAGLCGLGIWYMWGHELAEQFYAGYLVEESLSVDNLFAFLLLFDYFQVPVGNQERVLNWGVFGAVVTRAVMIALGAAALESFRPILLVFAGILIVGSVRVLLRGDEDEVEEEDMSNNAIVQFSRKFFDSVDTFDGDRFFTVVDGVKKATPLLICMIAVEITDVVFAIDSIPAVFGVTENPFIVFSSNIFAILGLRSLYTIISKAASDLEYLEPAVAVVLGFIGSKMVAEYFGYAISTEVSLAIVVTLLATGIGLSVLSKRLNCDDGEDV